MLKIHERECQHHDCDFHPTLPQLNRKMQAWGLSNSSKSGGAQVATPSFDAPLVVDPSLPGVFPNVHQAYNRDGVTQVNDPGDSSSDPTVVLGQSSFLELDSDTEDSDTGDGQRSPVMDEYGTALTLVASNRHSESSLRVEHATPFEAEATYCEDTCCTTLFRSHKKLMAASFLAGLRCWREASGILNKLIAELDPNLSISVSERTWVKLIYNRIKGSIFNPDKSTNIWSTTGWLNMSDPLSDYIKQAESQVLPSALATLCLTTQYRRLGSFEYYLLAADNYDSYDGQVRVLSLELQAYEQQSRILLGILSWCNDILAHPTFREAVEMLPAFVEHTDGLRESVLPRLLACHFMSFWIDEPPQALSKNLISLKTRARAVFVPEFMLPETFIAISHIILKRTQHFPMLSASTFVNGLLQALKTATRESCQLHVEHYCNEIASTLITVCSQTSTNPQANCPHSEHLVMQTAHKMMGTNNLGARGLEKPFTWIRTAENFRVNSIYHCPGLPASDRRETSIDPANLRDGSASATQSSGTDSSSEQDPHWRTHVKNKSSTSTIEELLDASHRMLIDDPNECSIDVITPLKAVRSGTPRRTPTTSTEREMRDMTARQQTAVDLMKKGIFDVPGRTSSKASSGSSRMSWAANRLFGIDRMGSHRSTDRFSFLNGDEQFTTAIPLDQAMQVLYSPTDERRGPSDVEWQMNVSRWVRNQSTPISLGRSTSAA